MRILVTPTFDRAVKKLHRKQKAELDVAVKAVVGDTEIGEAKVGDLIGIRVYKFHMANQLCLIAYRVIDESSIKLLMIGSHENFYRELKRLES
jgi:mRNA-degrading endonuclease RelE of RelBE toxin-antitoxin system